MKQKHVAYNGNCSVVRKVDDRYIFVHARRIINNLFSCMGQWIHTDGCHEYRRPTCRRVRLGKDKKRARRSDDSWWKSALVSVTERLAVIHSLCRFAEPSVFSRSLWGYKSLSFRGVRIRHRAAVTCPQVRRPCIFDRPGCRALVFVVLSRSVSFMRSLECLGQFRQNLYNFHRVIGLNHD